MKRRTFLIAAGAMPQAQGPPPATDRTTGAQPRECGNRTQLFVGNLPGRQMRGVWAVPNQAEKLAQPVMKADRPWEGWRLCLFRKRPLRSGRESAHNVVSR
jgi:hypothetical protein